MIKGKTPRKKRNKFLKKMVNAGNGFYEYIRGQDMFGQPVLLNYKGDDTFKTLIGGIITIGITLIIVAYTLLKFKYMIVHFDWNITK